MTANSSSVGCGAARIVESIGEADQVAADAVADTEVLDALVGLMSHSEPAIAVRAADALEKATRVRPGALDHHADGLLAMIATIEQPEVRWHLPPLVARLERVAALVIHHQHQGGPAVRARCRRLLAQLRQEGDQPAGS